MAAADFFEITIHGKSSHAGVCPEAGIDAIVISSELILSLQTIVSRQVGPKDTAVVSVCTIEGGNAANIIADKVKITGTIRTLDQDVHEKVLQLMQSRCDVFAEMYDTRIDLNYFYRTPLTINHERIVQVAIDSAKKIFDEENISDDISIMGGEDFAYIAQQTPSCFALLGTKVEHGTAYPLHSPKMCVNEDALPLGAAYLAQTALDLLNSTNKK